MIACECRIVRRMLPVLSLLLVTALGPALAAGDQVLIVGSSVRIRNGPRTTGDTVGVVFFGDQLTVLEQTAKPEKIGDLEGFWLKVRPASGKEGWVFGPLTLPYDPAQPYESLERAFDRRLETYNPTEEEARAFLTYVSRQARELNTSADQLFFGVYEHLARQFLLQSFTSRQLTEKGLQIPEIKPFLKDLVYSEPAGQHFVVAEVLWKLHDDNKGTHVSDRVAWRIARCPLPGETEGYLPAVIAVVRLTQGRYLERYPQGAFVGAAMDSMADYLGQFVEDPTLGPGPLTNDEKAGLRKDLDEFLRLLEPVTHEKAARVRELLGKLADRAK